jgi:hypothetical protein
MPRAAAPLSKGSEEDEPQRAPSPRTSAIDSNDLPSQTTTVRSASVEVPSDSESSPSPSPSSPSPSPSAAAVPGIEFEEDSSEAVQGLEALAAAAAPAAPALRTLLSPSPTPAAADTEARVLSRLFGSLEADSAEDTAWERFVSPSEPLRKAVKGRVGAVIEKADSCMAAACMTLRIGPIMARFLTRLLSQETQRLGRADFSAMLLARDFLPAVCTVLLRLPHIVRAALSVEDTAKAMDVALFDVLLAIEPTLRAFPELLRLPDLQRSVRALEEHLMESCVWMEPEGPLYPLLEAECSATGDAHGGTLSSPLLASVSKLRASKKALEALSGFTSSGASLTRLELFFRKFLRLASVRLQVATKSLGLPAAVAQMSWEFFVELVEAEGRPGRARLFQHRHLNQILMAVLYAVARMLDHERTFAQIASSLRGCQRHLGLTVSSWIDPATGHTAPVRCDRQRSCDYFTFYNEIFLPPLQKRLLRLLHLHQRAVEEMDWESGSLLSPPVTSATDTKRLRSASAANPNAPNGPVQLLDRLFTPAPLPAPLPSRNLSPNVCLELASLTSPLRSGPSRGHPKAVPASTTYELYDPASGGAKGTGFAAGQGTSETEYDDEDVHGLGVSEQTHQETSSSFPSSYTQHQLHLNSPNSAADARHRKTRLPPHPDDFSFSSTSAG